MGRPQKPMHLKVLHGDREDRINREAPRPSGADVACPSWISSKAKAMWREQAPDLVRTGQLSARDRHAFAALCEEFALWRDAMDQVAEEGPTIVGARGGLVQHPAALVADKALASFVRLASRFGMTPLDRQRLVANAEADGGDKERYLTL